MPTIPKPKRPKSVPNSYGGAQRKIKPPSMGSNWRVHHPDVMRFQKSDHAKKTASKAKRFR